VIRVVVVLPGAVVYNEVIFTSLAHTLAVLALIHFIVEQLVFLCLQQRIAVSLCSQLAPKSSARATNTHPNTFSRKRGWSMRKITSLKSLSFSLRVSLSRFPRRRPRAGASSATPQVSHPPKTQHTISALTIIRRVSHAALGALEGVHLLQLV
jgi:hypothetical protein